MTENRLPRRTVEWELHGIRRSGRPKERWTDEVRRSMTNQGMEEEGSLDREVWRLRFCFCTVQWANPWMNVLINVLGGEMILRYKFSISFTSVIRTNARGRNVKCARPSHTTTLPQPALYIHTTDPSTNSRCRFIYFRQVCSNNGGGRGIKGNETRYIQA